MQRKTFRHYFSVQDNSNYHGTEKTGALHRSNFPWLYKNLRCNIQEVNRQDSVLKYNIEVSEKLFVIYHNFDAVFDEEHRFVVNVNPLRQIADNPSIDNILILEYRGRRVSVYSRNRQKITHEIYAEFNNRWRL